MLNSSQAILNALARGNEDLKAVPGVLRSIRETVLRRGLPPDAGKTIPGSPCSARALVWKVLLGVTRVSAREYAELVRRGPSRAYNKIRDDTFRTFRSDPAFAHHVSEASLSRILNAYEHLAEDRVEAKTNGSGVCSDSHSRRGSVSHLVARGDASKSTKGKAEGGSGGGDGVKTIHPSDVVYTQGMNVLAGVLLSVLPEVDAFFCLDRLLTSWIPTYVLRNPRGRKLAGAHVAAALVHTVLNVVDPELADHLSSHQVVPVAYAFAPSLTLSACTPPLAELVELWDYLFSFGVHHNVYCVVAQLLRFKDLLIAHPSPGVLLRALPSLEARSVLSVAAAVSQQIPTVLLDVILRHTVDFTAEDTLESMADMDEMGGVAGGGGGYDGEFSSTASGTGASPRGHRGRTPSTSIHLEMEDFLTEGLFRDPEGLLSGVYLQGLLETHFPDSESAVRQKAMRAAVSKKTGGTLQQQRVAMVWYVCGVGISKKFLKEKGLPSPKPEEMETAGSSSEDAAKTRGGSVGLGQDSSSEGPPSNSRRQPSRRTHSVGLTGIRDSSQDIYRAPVATSFARDVSVGRDERESGGKKKSHQRRESRGGRRAYIPPSPKVGMSLKRQDISKFMKTLGTPAGEERVLDASGMLEALGGLTPTAASSVGKGLFPHENAPSSPTTPPSFLATAVSNSGPVKAVGGAPANSKKTAPAIRRKRRD